MCSGKASRTQFALLLPCYGCGGLPTESHACPTMMYVAYAWICALEISTNRLLLPGCSCLHDTRLSHACIIACVHACLTMVHVASAWACPLEVSTDRSLLPCMRLSAFQVLWPCRTMTMRWGTLIGGRGGGGAWEGEEMLESVRRVLMLSSSCGKCIIRSLFHVSNAHQRRNVDSGLSTMHGREKDAVAWVAQY